MMSYVSSITFYHCLTGNSIQECAHNNAESVRLACDVNEYVILTRATYVKPLFGSTQCDDQPYAPENRDLVLDLQALLAHHCEGKSHCDVKLEWSMWADVTESSAGVYRGEASFRVDFYCSSK